MPPANRNHNSDVRSCRAFTITELLVVMALLVALMVILIPAINSVRESSRTAKCSANQNQLALALTRFDARNGALPGWRHRVTFPAGARWVGFVFPILPFFDQTEVYDTYLSGSTTGQSSHEIETLQCPSIGTTGGYLPGRGDYGANFGTGYGTNWLGQQEGQASPNFRPFKDDGALADAAAPTGAQTQSLDGISTADGISMTLLTSEVNRAVWLTGGNCFSNTVYQGQNAGCMVFGITVQAAGTGTIPVVTNGLQVINGTLNMSPKSRHNNGVVASFADGSTRFLTDGLAPHVYAHVVTSRSLFSSASPITYGNNSRNANSYLRAPPAPASPFKVSEADLK
jgi:prepilin-type processing-associated H-X9-DG protein